MSENNFLPYEIKKKKYVVKNKIVGFIICALFILNLIFCIKIFMNETNYKGSINSEKIMDYKKVSNDSLKAKKKNFKNIDIFNDITKEAKCKKLSDIEIKNGMCNFSLNNNDLKNVVLEVEKNFKIISISKSQNNNLYNFIVEGEKGEE